MHDDTVVVSSTQGQSKQGEKIMATQNNKEFIESYFAAISGTAKPTGIVSQYVDDAVLMHHVKMFEAAFPKYELIADDIISEGDKVVVRATFRGLHKGDFNGIPATGKAVDIPLMLIYRLANGKVAEHWMNADSLGLLQQIGAVPAPA
jgi:predicted ester cyclase